MERKKLPRTFNRVPAPWLQAVFDLPALTSEAIVQLRRDALKLSREDAARVLRVSRNTVWDWETGVRRPPFSAYLALRCLAESAKRSVLPIDPGTDLPAPDPSKLVVERHAGSHGRVLQIQARMQAYASIYNAAWLVRDSWYGPGMRRQAAVWGLVTALVRELRDCSDFEALLYAIADALTASPLGVPWKEEGERKIRRMRSAETEDAKSGR